MTLEITSLLTTKSKTRRNVRKSAVMTTGTKDEIETGNGIEMIDGTEIERGTDMVIDEIEEREIGGTEIVETGTGMIEGRNHTLRNL
jgi:hypothetical protein